jgi:hypothetical protein
VIHVQTCSAIVMTSSSLKQHGAERPAFGSKLLVIKAEDLTGEFGPGFDERKCRLALRGEDELRAELEREQDDAFQPCLGGAD